MALTVKTILAFLEYIFQFFINKALPASSGVDRQNFKDQKRIFKMKFNDGSFYFSSSVFWSFCFVFFGKHFRFFTNSRWPNLYICALVVFLHRFFSARMINRFPRFLPHLMVAL